MSSGSGSGKVKWFSKRLGWQLAALKLCLIAAVAVALDRPVGSISGTVALAEKGFDLYTYNLRDNKVYAMAFGPRGKNAQERGVWVNNDGTFEINQLPVGEYSLKLRAPGFGTENIYGVLVEEGKTKSPPKAIRLSLLAPSVNIASNSRVFTTKEKPHFWVNATGASQAKVKLYKQDFLPLLKEKGNTKYGVEVATDFGFFISNAAAFVDPFAKMGLQPIATFDRKLTQDSTDSAHAEFQNDKPLPAGDYFAVVTAKDLFGKNETHSMTWFSVSDLGLVIKQAPKETVVRAIDLNTLQGLPDVEIRVAERGEKSAGVAAAKPLARTGKDGLARIAMPQALAGKSGFDLNVYGVIKDNRAYAGYNVWRNDADKHRTYFYTDRPVYRLGQTVCFKGISRSIDSDKGLVNDQGGKEKLTVNVEDPDNNQIATYNFTTTKNGTFNGVIDIPKDAKTGGYQVTINYPDGYTSYQSFEVAEYRKPEYLVEVVPITDRVTAGQKGKARVQASYYFGGPVANARVKYSIYSSSDWGTRNKLSDRPEYYAFFDGWHGDGEDEYYEGSGDLVTEGYAVTDENGEAVIEFATTGNEAINISDQPPGNNFGDKKLKIEAEVTDLSRQSAVGSGFVPMTAGDFFVDVAPQNYVVTPGQTMACDVVARDYKGKPMPGQQVDLYVMRYPWDSFNYEYKKGIQVAKQTAKTDDQGRLHFAFKSEDQWASDNYEVIAVSRDASGHTVLSSSSIWVASGEQPFFFSPREAVKEPLQVRLDKRVYKAGDIAKVIISGPFTGKEANRMDAIVSIEGTRLHEIKIVPLTSSAQLVEIPIKPEYIPNFYVTATVVTAKKQFYNEEKMVMVSPESNFLKLAVESDKDRYKPGETAHYTIKATRADGKPASDVELSLGLVDESIYSIRAETAPDINKYFFSQIANAVTTTYSFPEQYSGGPDKLEPRVRKNFKDTAAWLPVLKTDAQGIATASVPLPDNLTTWRATVRGASTGNNFGSAISKVMSTQDLIARLALPRFYRTGDQSDLTAVVHNYSTTAQDVRLDLSISDNIKLAQSLPLTQNVRIEPQKAARLAWPIEAGRVGRARVSLKAVGKTAADALEKEIDVLPMGVRADAIKVGVIQDGKTQGSIALDNLPARDLIVPGTFTSTLDLAASTIAPVLGNFSALIDYPYGCTEQTMSRLTPSTVAMQLHKKLGAPLSAKDMAKFDKVYKASMDKISTYQHGDGGWGWWPNDNTSLYLTALVLDGLDGLKQAGYAVPTDMTSRGLDWQAKAMGDLAKQMADPKRVKEKNRDEWQDYSYKTDLAYCLYTQYLWPGTANRNKSKSLDTCKKYLDGQIDDMPPEALSYLARAARLAGQKTDAQRYLQKLLAKADRSGDYLSFENLKYQQYRFTQAELTALTLQAVLEIDPADSSDIDKCKAYLMAHRGTQKDGWYTTKTTAQVFKALLLDELTFCKQGASDLVSSMSIDLGLSDPVILPDRLAYRSIKIPEGKVPDSRQKAINLQKSGPGRLFYNLAASFFVDLTKPGANIIKNRPDDLKIERSFYRLQSVANTSDGTIHLKSVPLGDAPIKSGETILMKTTVETGRALPYVMVEAALPSGAEVITDGDRSAAVDKAENENNYISGDWQVPWWTHQDVLDDRIVYFGSDLRAGKSEFTTLLRMENPGTVRISPVSMETMYSKAVRAFSNVSSLKIVK